MRVDLDIPCSIISSVSHEHPLRDKISELQVEPEGRAETKPGPS